MYKKLNSTGTLIQRTTMEAPQQVVQFTPRGSGCSVQFGTKITTAPPGSAEGLYLIVPDIEAARTSSLPAVSRSARCSIL